MLAETGSVQRTAQAIGIPPSSLEQVLSQLQEMFGAELFRGEGSALQPTPACVALLPHAREVIRAVAGGAGAVLVTNGREVEIPPGTVVNALVQSALTVRVPIK